KRNLTLVPDVTGLHFFGPSPCGPLTTFNGDLAVTTSFVPDFTYVSFIDVTDLAAPCQLSNKILTSTPGAELFETVRHGTFELFGIARGVAVLRHSEGIEAYAAIAEAGLMAVDIASNVPEVQNSQRRLEPMLAGDYYDVIAYSGNLVALNRGLRQ